MKISLKFPKLLSIGTAGKFILLGVLVTLVSIAGWLTHVIVSLMAKSYLLLLVGAIFFPIGIIHGVGSWFGAF